MQKNITIILLEKLDNTSEKNLFFKEYKKKKSIKWLKKIVNLLISLIKIMYSGLIAV